MLCYPRIHSLSISSIRCTLIAFFYFRGAKLRTNDRTYVCRIVWRNATRARSPASSIAIKAHGLALPAFVGDVCAADTRHRLAHSTHKICGLIGARASCKHHTHFFDARTTAHNSQLFVVSSFRLFSRFSSSHPPLLLHLFVRRFHTFLPFRCISTVCIHGRRPCCRRRCRHCREFVSSNNNRMAHKNTTKRKQREQERKMKEKTNSK